MPRAHCPLLLTRKIPSAGFLLSGSQVSLSFAGPSDPLAPPARVFARNNSLQACSRRPHSWFHTGRACSWTTLPQSSQTWEACFDPPTSGLEEDPHLRIMTDGVVLASRLGHFQPRQIEMSCLSVAAISVFLDPGSGDILCNTGTVLGPTQ